MARPTKRDIASAILDMSQSVNGSKLSKTVAAYLISERRSGELDAIMREVKTLRRQHNGVDEATLTTAFPASSNVKRQLKQLLGSDKVVMNEVIDKSIIGGVRLEASDYYLDLTVRDRLNKLKIGAIN